MTVIVVSSLSLAACATSTAGHPTAFTANSAKDHQPASSGAATPLPSGDPACTIYENGQNVRVTFTGPSASAVCTQSATNLSAGGEFWSQQPVQSSGDLSLVCAMISGEEVAEVDDSGSRLQGQNVCSAFLQSGWTEDQSAEASAAASSAAASAALSETAASQAQQAQDAQDQARVAGDTTTLTDDADFSNDLTQMASDMATTDADLAKTRSDATEGPGDDCYNVSNVVGYDAVNNVEYDAQNDIEYDVTNDLTYDFTTVATDIQNLQSAVQQLGNDGLAIPSSAGAAITTANNAISTATAAANRYIDRTNADVAAAYAVANAMATGSCAGTGPGSPPSPLPHLT